MANLHTESRQKAPIAQRDINAEHSLSNHALTLRIGHWEQSSAIRPQSNQHDRTTSAALLPAYDRYEWFHLLITMKFASSLYIALSFVVTSRNVLMEHLQRSIFVVACFILTTLYTSMFVILFHFHDKIGCFLQHSFGIPRSVQRQCLRFIGYLLASVILMVLIGGHMTYNVRIAWRSYGYVDVPLH